MTKKEIISGVSDRTGLSLNESRAAVESFMEEIKDAVNAGKSVFLRGFGTFKPQRRKQKTGRNISKGSNVVIPEQVTPKFKPCDTFKIACRTNNK